MRHAFFVAAAVLVASIGFAHEAQAGVDTHTIFLNNCEPSGCTIHAGNTNATTDTSDLVTGTQTLTAFNQSAGVWATVVSGVRTIMSPYDVTITETRPTSGDYFEVMVAGQSSDIGLGGGVGAIGDVSCSSPGECQPFVANALSFAFANEGFYTGNPNSLSGGALQSLAGSWSLDHVVDGTDVMSYNEEGDGGILAFHDHEACGSDCVSGMSPFNLPCTGSGGNATHTCESTGTATQNEVQILLALFGAAPDAGTPDDAGVTDAGGGGPDASASSDAGSGGSDSGASTSRVDGGSTDDGDSGDSGGCNVSSSTDSAFSFGGMALVLMTLGFGRRRRSKV